jgi:radical SAM superfamily enzyme
MDFLKPAPSPPCTHIQRVSQLISDPSADGQKIHKYIDTHFNCSQYDKKIKRTDCINCPKYSPTIQRNDN